MRVVFVQKRTFEQWMSAVDNLTWQEVGCSVHDLPDCDFRSWYEDEVGPAEAAKRAVKKAFT